MSAVYITFPSVTGAMEGKKLLDRRGIRASLLRTPEALRKRGCGYSLRLSQGAEAEAKALLEGWGIKYERIFREDPRDRWQEVAL